MKCRIEFTRDDKPDGNGYEIAGKMMGTIDGCLDILAYCVIRLSKTRDTFPPVVLGALFEKVEMLDEKGICDDDKDLIVNTKFEIPKSVMDILKKENSEGCDND